MQGATIKVIKFLFKKTILQLQNLIHLYRTDLAQNLTCDSAQTISFSNIYMYDTHLGGNSKNYNPVTHVFTLTHVCLFPVYTSYPNFMFC